ncbi:MAG: flavohemoglobin expression-modulating QEGLA motif protein [Bacteriovoracaceae bacterium]|nr:flavohemoglobin expression-modulating QEGLA motif protein [Bacteriovoracaceae bacterium]
MIIDDYVPYICAAIHNGGNLRPELKDKINLTRNERWYEEDPLTGDFISPFPIRIIANDSRYEYDLNRPLNECIYTKVWGKKVWSKKLSKVDKDLSLKKHQNFYMVVLTLVFELEKRFNACLVYDIHSYNYKRITGKAPLFNIGTENIEKKFNKYVNHWKIELSKIQSEYIDVEVEEKDVFMGRGNFLKTITKSRKKTLVLATEIKKVYCDELSGDVFPEVVADIKEGLKNAVVNNANYFIEKRAKYVAKKKHEILSSTIDATALKIDTEIFKLLKKLDVLEFINPRNLEKEKKQFTTSKYRKNPQFEYCPLNIDGPLLKRKLYDLPVDDIADVALQNLYRGVIDSYIDEIDLLSFRGSEKFMYTSLRYYGAPSDEDKRMANFLLRCPEYQEENEILRTCNAIDEIQEEIDSYGFTGKIEQVINIPSHAVFSPSKRTLKVKSGICFNTKHLKALRHHEIGIHMLTTENALLQPLKVLQLGFPLNTHTQEGLAILSEYKSGNLTISRLKELALRVIAVDHQIKNNDFKETFVFLVDEYNLEFDKAFYLTTRVYRSGGMTKDYLYLKGFKDILKIAGDREKLNLLLVGKTSIGYLDTINELIVRKILNVPKYISKSFLLKNTKKDKILDYLIGAL